MVADGFDNAQLQELRSTIKAAGTMTFIVGPRRGKVSSAYELEHATESEADAPEEKDDGIYADFSLSTAKSTLIDAIVVVGGAESVATLRTNGEAIQWINEAYKHFKTIGAVGEAVALLRSDTAVPDTALSEDDSVVSEHGVVTVRKFVPSGEPGSIVGTAVEAVKSLGKTGIFAKQYITAMGQHRHWDREVTRIPA